MGLFLDMSDVQYVQYWMKYVQYWTNTAISQQSDNGQGWFFSPHQFIFHILTSTVLHRYKGLFVIYEQPLKWNTPNSSGRICEWDVEMLLSGRTADPDRAREHGSTQPPPSASSQTRPWPGVFSPHTPWPPLRCVPFWPPNMQTICC